MNCPHCGDPTENVGIQMVVGGPDPDDDYGVEVPCLCDGCEELERRAMAWVEQQENAVQT